MPFILTIVATPLCPMHRTYPIRVKLNGNARVKRQSRECGTRLHDLNGPKLDLAAIACIATRSISDCRHWLLWDVAKTREKKELICRKCSTVCWSSRPQKLHSLSPRRFCKVQSPGTSWRVCAIREDTCNATSLPPSPCCSSKMLVLDTAGSNNQEMDKVHKRPLLQMEAFENPLVLRRSTCNLLCHYFILHRLIVKWAIYT